MKQYLFVILTFTLPLFCFSQETKEAVETPFDSKQFLKEISENACKCIDSIDTGTKNKTEISQDIHKCIDAQTTAYQLGLKLSDIKNISEQADDKKNITIEISSDPNSKEYKKFYYEIERHLIANCPSIKVKIAINDVSEKTMPNNGEALKYYNLGLDESKKENFAKAIEYYKKSVVFDDQFAFAYDNMGICYRRLNQFDEAIDAYEKSLKIDPNGKMPLQNIAVVYVYKKEYKKAIKAYERLAKIDKSDPEVFYGIGSIYAQHLNDYEKALDNLCTAYNIYITQKSPYRTDAEKLIQVVYTEMKKQGKVDAFNKILEKHHISQN